MAESEENNSPVLEAAAASSTRSPRQASTPYPSITPKAWNSFIRKHFFLFFKKKGALFGYAFLKYLVRVWD